MNEKCKDCKHSKHRTEIEKKELTRRLSIIEGQVRGIKQMLEDDRLCSDVLIQISAVNKSLKSIGNNILKSHMSTCVVEDIQNGNLEIIDDVMNLFARMEN